MLYFILWVLLVYGGVQILTYSDLFDWYRNYYLKNSGYPKVGEYYQITQTQPPKKLPVPFRIIYKILSCWLCAAFWLGTSFALIGLGPIQNPIIAGMMAVGSINVIKFITEKGSN